MPPNADPQDPLAQAADEKEPNRPAAAPAQTPGGQNLVDAAAAAGAAAGAAGAAGAGNAISPGADTNLNALASPMQAMQDIQGMGTGMGGAGMFGMGGGMGATGRGAIGDVAGMGQGRMVEHEYGRRPLFVSEIPGVGEVLHGWAGPVPLDELRAVRAEINATMSQEEIDDLYDDMEDMRRVVAEVLYRGATGMWP